MNNTWYPLLLSASLKDYLWGGSRLKNEFGFSDAQGNVAEAWVFSCHKNGESLIQNGPLAGKRLSEGIEAFGNDCLGKSAKHFPYFPILIKLIDAKEKLSLQVHPDDVYALAHEGEYGKTEMWYVVDCEPEAKLIYGLNHSVEKEELKCRIQEDTVSEICNVVPVHKGDVFFISAGTLHAIGGGILIAEVQQNSNTTYRVSDYGRLGADGKPRPLHQRQALDVIDRNPPRREYGSVGKIMQRGVALRRRLPSCTYFRSEVVEINGTTRVGKKNSFLSILALDGTGKALYHGEEITLRKGTSLFIPANRFIHITGNTKLLLSNV